MPTSGVDVVSTANNHALDRHSLGADRTIESLDHYGLAHTGTRRSDGSGSWYTTTTAGNIRIAWLACTYGTNGIRDAEHQVPGCYRDRSKVLSLVEELAHRQDIDVVFVSRLDQEKRRIRGHQRRPIQPGPCASRPHDSVPFDYWWVTTKHAPNERGEHTTVSFPAMRPRGQTAARRRHAER